MSGVVCVFLSRRYVDISALFCFVLLARPVAIFFAIHTYQVVAEKAHKEREGGTERGREGEGGAVFFVVFIIFFSLSFFTLV